MILRVCRVMIELYKMIIEMKSDNVNSQNDNGSNKMKIRVYKMIIVTTENKLLFLALAPHVFLLVR